MSGISRQLYNYSGYTPRFNYELIIPLLAILVRLLVYFIVPHTYEDAFITFRYAENLAAGDGLVYNIGERVYGSTAPLFAIIMAMFKTLGLSCVYSSLGINIAADGITSFIVFKLVPFSAVIISAILYYGDCLVFL